MHYYYRKFLLFSKHILPAVVLLLIYKIQLDTKIFYSICDFHLCSPGNRPSSSLAVKIACAKRWSIDFTECMPS